MAKFQVPDGWGTDELVDEIDRLRDIIDNVDEIDRLRDIIDKASSHLNTVNAERIPAGARSLLEVFGGAAIAASKAGTSLRRQSASMTTTLTDREREVLIKRFAHDPDKMEVICTRCKEIVKLSKSRRDPETNGDFCFTCHPPT